MADGELGKELFLHGKADALVRIGKGRTGNGIAEFIDADKAQCALVVTDLDQRLLRMGDDVAIAVDDQRLSGLADLETCQELRDIADLDIDADDALDVRTAFQNRRGQRDAGLLGRKEDIGIGPDGRQALLGTVIPWPAARIECVCRVQFIANAAEILVAPDEFDPALAIGKGDQLRSIGSGTVAAHDIDEASVLAAEIQPRELRGDLQLLEQEQFQLMGIIAGDDLVLGQACCKFGGPASGVQKAL